MKSFRSADVDRSGQYARIRCEVSDMIDNPPGWLRAGRQETASGYGRRMNTGRSIRFNGRMRRVYCVCYSNSVTCYIRGGGGNYIDGGIIIDAM